MVAWGLFVLHADGVAAVHRAEPRLSRAGCGGGEFPAATGRVGGVRGFAEENAGAEAGSSDHDGADSESSVDARVSAAPDECGAEADCVLPGERVP